VSLANDLLKKYEPDIESLTLMPSDGGCFEVSVNGAVLYSKLKTGRFAEPGEISRLLEKFMHL